MIDYEDHDESIIQIERQFSIKIYNRVPTTVIEYMEISNNNDLI